MKLMRFLQTLLQTRTRHYEIVGPLSNGWLIQEGTRYTGNDNEKED